MRVNKKTLNITLVRIMTKWGIFLLAAFVVFVLAAGSDIGAAGKVQASGMLTAVEEDGTVIIDEKGYLMSPSATVQNYRAEKTSLDSLLPSSVVEFEYQYEPRGFVIYFIKEIPQ